MPRPLTVSLRCLRLSAFAALSVLAAGCAQQAAPGYYDTQRESTLSDAQHQAQGRGNATAPSQLQFGFGDTETAPPSASAPEAPGGTLPAPLAEAATFLGTV